MDNLEARIAANEKRIAANEARIADLEDKLVTAVRLSDILAEGFKVLTKSHEHYSDFMERIKELLQKLLPKEVLHGPRAINEPGTINPGRGVP